MANPLKSYYGRAKFKQLWSGQWQTIAGVWPVRCLRGCAPVDQSADFHFDFGKMKRETETTFAIEPPIDLRDWYVKIELYDKDDPGVALPHWYGIISRSTTLRKGGVTSALTGHQSFQAVGLEHILDREPVANTVVSQVVGAATECFPINTVEPFNIRYKKGLRVKGNRSREVGEDGVYVVSNASNAESWNNKQIIEYLLWYFQPEGPTWTLSGQVDALEALQEVYNVSHGEVRSLWDWLKILIDRRRGLGFVVEPNDTESEINIRVFTIVDEDVTVGGRTIPANDNQIPFTMPNTFPETHLLEPIPITKTTAHVYDVIEVRGERMLACGTVSHYDDRLQLPTKQQEKTDYFNADEEGRHADRFIGTWTKHIFHPNWNYNFTQILDVNSDDSWLLRCDEDGNVTAGGGKIWYDNIRIERSLPFKKGWDYTQVPPRNNNEDSDKPEFLPLQIFAKLPADVMQAGKWRMVERLGDGDTGLPSCNTRVLDTTAGFELHCAPRHIWAVDDWPKDADGGFRNVEYPPRMSYKDVAATVAIRTNHRLMVSAEITAGVPHEARRTLVINCPGAEYWYAVRGTVVDVEGGALRRIADGNRVLRDDSDILRSILAFAVAWYERDRQSITLNIKEVDNHAPLGSLITSIEGQYQEDVNTILSSIETDFESRTMKYQTGWGEFDVVGALVEDKKGIASRRANEIEYLND